MSVDRNLNAFSKPGRLSSRRVVVLATLAALALPASVEADEQPGALTARPETWDMSLDELRALGLGQYRGDPIPVPDDAPRLRAPDQPPVAATQGVMFVNFDGAQLSSGFDDARQNRTQIDELVGSFASYGDSAKRDAVMQAVRQDWSAYNVVVTDTRPASGDYVMNMTGPTNPFGSGVLGIAPLDCNDSQTHNNITYAFHSANDNFSASTTATTIGQEVAHSFGLEHVDEPGDIMNPFNAGGDPQFRDQCIVIVQGGTCGQQHAAECGSSQSQNSHRELLRLFGPSQPDTAIPTVQITTPQDGASFGLGSTFQIEVQAGDDIGVSEVALFNNGDQIQTDASEPYGWTVEDPPEGTYEFYVEARDLAGNTAMSNVVTVTITPDAPSNEDGGDSGGNGTGGVDSGGADSAGDGGGTSGGGVGDGVGDGEDGNDAFASGSGGALPPGFGGTDDAAPEGCACTTDRTRGGLAPLILAFVALGWLRRRR